MKAIRVHSFGGPEVLHYEDVADPQPAPDEALVRIAAIGVNYMDVYQRLGRYGAQPPFTPGTEACGTVEAVGEEVVGVAVGDRVAAVSFAGSYAQLACVAANRLVKLPNWMTVEDGAAFGLQGMTAHYILTDFYDVGTGTTILIHAVAGGVGLLATQLAKHLGARVIGTTSSEQKAQVAKAAGADEVILYTQTDFVDEVARLTGGRGVDLILDGVGKATFPGDLKAVRIRGTIVLFGSASGRAEPFGPNTLQERSLVLAGGRLPAFIATPQELQRRAGAVISGLHDRWLHLRIDRTLPLSDAAQAHRLLESRGTMGKIVLEGVSGVSAGRRWGWDWVR